MDNTFWNKKEIEYLRKSYPTDTKEKILKLLSGRTWSGIQRKAFGLKIRRKSVFWFRKIKPLKLTDFERGYLAGIIDGEGSIAIIEDRRRKGYGKFRPKIYIGNSDKRMLDYCQQILNNLGILKIYKELKPEKNQKIIYAYHIQTFPEIIEFLNVIKDSLVIKKEQAYLMLRFLKIREEHFRRSDVSEEELEIVNKIRKLNKRGLQEFKPLTLTKFK